MKNSQLWKLYLNLAVLFCLWPNSLWADMPGSNPTPLERPSLPQFEDNSSSTPPLSSPPTTLQELPPIPENNQSLSSIDKIYVKKFNLKGHQVISEEELRKIVQDYENKEISAEQLQEVKNKITNYYIEKKYISSGAIIPDQQVQDGIVTIEIIEGQLVQVDVSGHKKLRPSYIRKRLEDKKGAALNLNTLQERLQLLQQNPLLKRINAELGPGIRLGEGVLKIQIEEASPYQLQFNFNNHRSPSVGAYRAEMEGWHRNFTGLLFGQGWGDSFYLRYGLTEGLKDYTVRYSLPLNRYDTTLSFNIERSDSEVVESPFNQLDVESEADTYAVTLSHPLLKKPNRSFELGLRLEKRKSKTFLLGRPFSFSAGVRNGESDLSVIRFSQDWLTRSRTEVIAARSSFNFGIDALDSTINDDGSPDSQFFTWLGQFQYVRRLDFLTQERLNRSQILFRIDFQWANQELLPLEKFSIGGASTVRGYRENQLTRDNGLISSFEWRVPLWRLPIAKISKNPEDGLLEISPFIDYGRAWNKEGDTPSPKDIYSTGLGLRWGPNQNLQTELYWAKGWRDMPDPEDEDLQDKGIHFEVSIIF